MHRVTRSRRGTSPTPSCPRTSTPTSAPGPWSSPRPAGSSTSVRPRPTPARTRPSATTPPTPSNLTQTSTIPVLPAIGGPQVANNGGNAANTSRGTAGDRHRQGPCHRQPLHHLPGPAGRGRRARLRDPARRHRQHRHRSRQHRHQHRHGQRLDQHRHPHPDRLRSGHRLQRGLGHQRLRRLRPDRRPRLLPRGEGPRQARPARHRRRRHPAGSRRRAAAAPGGLRPPPGRPQGQRLASRRGLVQLHEVA